MRIFEVLKSQRHLRRLNKPGSFGYFRGKSIAVPKSTKKSNKPELSNDEWWEQLQREVVKKKAKENG